MTPRDKLLIIIIAVVALAGLAVEQLMLPANEGARATVKVQGEMFRSIDLDVPGTKRISINGVEGLSVFELKDGKIKMISSPCPDKLCIQQGWVSRPGQTIVCVPNAVSISVLGNGGVDTIVR